jgi:hypothetical protein
MNEIKSNLINNDIESGENQNYGSFNGSCNEEEICYICFETKHRIKLTCNHKICKECLLKWKNNNNNNICTLCPWCKNPIDNKIFKQIGYSYNQPNKIVINRISDRNRFIYVNRIRYQDNSLVDNLQVCCFVFIILIVGVFCYFLAYWVPKD